MPERAEVYHGDKSKTVIEQDPSGDYHVFDVMPDGSTEERGDFGSGHTLDELMGMFTRLEDSPPDVSTDTSVESPDSESEEDDSNTDDVDASDEKGSEEGAEENTSEEGAEENNSEEGGRNGIDGEG